MEMSKKYIIYTEMGYYAGANHKYADMVNTTAAKRYAYTFDGKETAYKKAEYLQRVYFAAVEVQEVLANYTGEWKGGSFIVGEHYSEYELGIKN